MKALVLSEYKHLEVMDVPTPKPGPEEVLVKVEACGICGSDVHGYDGSTGRRLPPLIMGHEAAGTVAEVGPGVEGLSKGDRVTFDSTIYCGVCEYCRKGEVNLCNQRQVLGVATPEFKRAGAFAEYVVVPQRVMYRLPDGVSAAKAAMIEPLAVAVHAVSLAEIAPDATVIVLGAGMIGLLVLQVLKHKGCRNLVVVDLDDTRLASARALGATEVINAKTGDLPGTVSKLTRGAGADVAFEAVGSTPTVRSAIENVRKGGTVVLIGNVSPNVEIPLQVMVSRELTLHGSAASSGEYPECIDLLNQGVVTVDPLITAIAPLEKGPEWFERLYAREPNLMKVLLTPDVAEGGAK